MSDTLMDDIRNNLRKIELSIKDGDRTIFFETKEEMNQYIEFRTRLESLYMRVSLNVDSE